MPKEAFGIGDLSAKWKSFIEYDGIEEEITQDLIPRGIPESDIVIAFLLEFEAVGVK